MSRSRLKIFFFSVLLFSLSDCASRQPDEKLGEHEKLGHLLSMATAAIRENDPITALKSLILAEDIEPDLPKIYHFKSLAYYQKQDLDLALESSKKAITLDPKYSAANNTYGKLLLDRGQYLEAEKYLKLAAFDTLNREAYIARTNLGILYYKKNDFRRAGMELDKATIESPDKACLAYFYKGHIDFKNANFDAAIKDYTRATKKLCGSNADAYYSLGVTYEKTKQFDLARKQYLEIKNLFPDTRVAEKAVERLRVIP